MHRCFQQAAREAARLPLFLPLLLLLLATASGASDPGTLEKAKAKLEKSDPKGAATLLEAALPKAKPTERAALLKQLRIAYQAAAKQAHSAGREAEAQDFLDDLEILNQAAASAQVKIAAGAKPTAPEPTASLPDLEVSEAPVDKIPEPDSAKDAGAIKAGSDLDVEPPSRKIPVGTPPEFVPPQGDPGALAPPSSRNESSKPGELVETPENASSEPEAAPEATQPDAKPAPAPTPTGPSVEGADEAFVGKRYHEANSIYSALNQARALPADRRDHWAYCRAVEVVRRINAKPADEKGWADIDVEIENIRKLSPKNWFADYLKSRASERNPKLNTSARELKTDSFVVRGASPDEEPRSAPVAKTAKPSSDFSPIETANFRVIHSNRELAEKIAKQAEIARGAQVTRWTGQLAAEPWNPRCEIHVYSNADKFSQETGQPKDSPGFSTMGMNSGKIVSRRINLRADHVNVVKAVLPHEVTHVVLADLFPTQQIPRWADEGVSVLAEPASEQAVRAAELEEPLASGKLFKLKDLMVMDYPDAEYWGLYYAQSVSLTRFLVETGTPLQFVTFVKASQQLGMESALKQVYKIQNEAELHGKWLTYAKSQSADSIASNPDKAPKQNR